MRNGQKKTVEKIALKKEKIWSEDLVWAVTFQEKKCYNQWDCFQWVVGWGCRVGKGDKQTGCANSECEKLINGLSPVQANGKVNKPYRKDYTFVKNYIF